MPSNANKIDSNITGLRIAEEQTLGVLPINPVWLPQEPNSYSDFGAEVSTVARNPINPSRQRKKGVVVDLDASGGFNQDLTQGNTQDLLQGFMFADFRQRAFSRLMQKRTSAAFTAATTGIFSLTAHGMMTGYGPVRLTGASLPTGVSTMTDYWVIAVTEDTFRLATSKANALAGTSVALTTSGSGNIASTFGATANGVVVDDATGFAIGQMIFVRGFSNAANNGLKTITAITGTELAFTGAAVEDPKYGITIASVGLVTPASDLTIDASGPLPLLKSASLDFVALGFTPGEWIYIGGDTAGAKFTNDENNGFKRVRAVTQAAITLDKSELAMITDSANTNGVAVYWGRFLRNEAGALIKRRTYNQERTLGSLNGADPQQAEYLVGAVPSTAVINLATAAKITTDLSFVATDSETRTQAQGLKPGLRPDNIEEDVFNTTSDVRRIRLALAGSTDEAPSPLFAFVTDLALTINNTLSSDKAIGKLGAIDVSAGTLAVSATTTAYFYDIASVSAVRNNSDVTLDMIFVKDNAGVITDMPLVSLGNGRATVELDKPIMLPLTTDAAGGGKISPNLDYTVGFTFFDYLPDAAETLV